MHSADFTILTLQFAAMLACALAGGQLMRRLGQPAVLGEMAGGIVLGPTVFGMLWPDAYDWLFPSEGVTGALRGGLIKVGMLFFLFLVGLEIQFADLRRHGWNALLIGLCGTLVPLICGVAVVYWLPGVWSIADPSQRLVYSLFIGISMANTANPVLARILYDLGLLKKSFGTLVLTATVVDDLIAWGVLLLVIGQYNAPQVHGTPMPVVFDFALIVLFLAGILILGRCIGAPLVKQSHAWLNGAAGAIAVIAVLVLVSAAISEALGIHGYLGPFVLGIALASTARERQDAYGMIHQFSLGFFVPIYFVSMGLTANFFTNFMPALVAVVIVTACVSKTLSVYAGARLGGLSNRTSWAVGFGMNARGATGIILAGIGLENAMIDHPTYVALVIMCLVTSLIAGPLMRNLLWPAEEVSPATAESISA
jgi:Kef-type K+ transport system membrane component KefB